MARRIDMSEQAKAARWRAGKEAGHGWVCSFCWSTQWEFGLCDGCRRFEVRPVAEKAQDDKPLPPPFPRAALTGPQMAYKSAQAERVRLGLPPLIARTQAQVDIDAGRVPARPGGVIEVEEVFVALTEQEVKALDMRGPEALRNAGCNCEFGCRNCGMSESQMGACPAWNPCPLGRARAKGCTVHGTES